MALIFLRFLHPPRTGESDMDSCQLSSIFIWGYYGTQYRVRSYPSILYKEYYLTRFNHQKNTTQLTTCQIDGPVCVPVNSAEIIEFTKTRDHKFHSTPYIYMCIYIHTIPYIPQLPLHVPLSFPCFFTMLTVCAPSPYIP